MNRRQDWPEQLAAWVEEVRARPFQWGVWDCAIAANDAVRRITDADVLGGLAWADVRSALRELEAEGGLAAAVTARLGEPIAPALAQRGDLVLLPRALGVDEPSIQFSTVLGVCVGGHAVGPNNAGLCFAPMSAALHAWKVGRG